MPMTHKAPRINCTHCADDRCTHYAAPRKLFGAARCVLINQTDPRITACAYQQPYRKPTAIFIFCTDPPKNKRDGLCDASKKETDT